MVPCVLMSALGSKLVSFLKALHAGLLNAFCGFDEFVPAYKARVYRIRFVTFL